MREQIKRKRFVILFFTLIVSLSLALIETQLFAKDCWCNDCEFAWVDFCFTRGGYPSDRVGDILIHTCNLRSCFMLGEVYCILRDLNGVEYERPFVVHCTTSYCEECDPPAK